MIAFYLLIGFALGWLLNNVSNILPRLSRHSQAAASSTLLPACIIAAAQRQPLTSALMLACGIELFSALAVAFLGSLAGWSAQFAILTTAYSFFALIALLDLKYRIIPNLLIYPAILVVLVLQLASGTHTPLSIVLGGCLAFGMFVLAARFRPGGLGGGDVKLAALIGLAFGFPQVLWALIIGIGAGGLVAVWLMARGYQRQSAIPYAPFLCLGAMVALLYNPIPILS